MTYVLDTSAIINIVQQKGKDSVPLLRSQHTLDLAYYESGNVIRTYFHRKRLSRVDCLQLASTISWAWSLMQVDVLVADEMQSVLTIALDNEIAFYDAAFMFQARKLKAILVTDDQAFQKKIPADIKWMDSSRVLDSDIKLNSS
jgi:predicted nucleic acid-binding protein